MNDRGGQWWTRGERGGNVARTPPRRSLTSADGAPGATGCGRAPPPGGRSACGRPASGAQGCGGPYNAPRCQGPVIAQVIPLPGEPSPKRLTNSTSPSGENVAPANSLSLRRLTANSKASPPRL